MSAALAALCRPDVIVAALALIVVYALAVAAVGTDLPRLARRRRGGRR